MSVYKILNEKFKSSNFNNQIKIEFYIYELTKIVDIAKNLPNDVKEIYIDTFCLSIDGVEIIGKDLLRELFKRRYKNEYDFTGPLHQISNNLYENVEIFFKLTRKTIDNFKIKLYQDNINFICFSLKYEDDELYCHIDLIKKSGVMSGSEILDAFSLLLRTFGKEIKYSTLEDQSTLQLPIMNDVNFPLYSLHILVKGYSWYNSFGYYQKDYEEEKQEWEKIRTLKFVDFLTVIQNSITESRQLKIKKELELKHDQILSIFNPEMLTMDVYTVIYQVIKNETELENHIVDIFILLLKISNLLFEYDDYLVKMNV